MDMSNTGVPGAGTTTGGAMARLFALKRMQKLQHAETVQQPGRVMSPKEPKLYVKKGTA